MGAASWEPCPPPCLLFYLLPCPPPCPSFILSYEVQLGGSLVSMSGCSVGCWKDVVQKACCPGYWGSQCYGMVQWWGVPVLWYRGFPVLRYGLVVGGLSAMVQGSFSAVVLGGVPVIWYGGVPVIWYRGVPVL